MITLYGMPSTAAMIPHILLREIGVPFDLTLLDREAGENRQPGYLALNPQGRVPTLVDGDLVVTETAAICLHLVDRHPEAGLAPAVGSAERAVFYKWIAYLTNTIQADMLVYFYPGRYVQGAEAEAALKAVVEARLFEQFSLLDKEMEGRRWLLGDRYGALDPYLFTLARWSRFMTRPARSLPNLGPWLARVLERPAVQAAFAAEGLSAPYF
ncbi:glutathione S-transferase family protein [Azospirillum thermophilum]|uniref:Glutathione S-transferase n=1 Tax=Azospirillum thermophilum TaxID=2202148 RepID=A0A2S2CPG1_9PROT|nr:glutathione S-transferase N-terminal domain-containing protein [Azospirillum thermophilum]AWK86366.1 glutathione S-transferase [Azospirillum thermophilum]